MHRRNPWFLGAVLSVLGLAACAPIPVTDDPGAEQATGEIKPKTACQQATEDLQSIETILKRLEGSAGKKSDADELGEKWFSDKVSFSLDGTSYGGYDEPAATAGALWAFVSAKKMVRYNAPPFDPPYGYSNSNTCPASWVAVDAIFLVPATDDAAPPETAESRTFVDLLGRKIRSLKISDL